MTNDSYAVFEILKASLWLEKGTVVDKSELWSETVRQEMRAQAVEGIAVAVIPELNVSKYIYTANFLKMLYAQKEIVKLLEGADIGCIILKGTSSGINYPAPHLRTYGDIDILVHPTHYQSTVELLNDNGYIQCGMIGKKVTMFTKNSIIIELHKHLPGVERVKEGEYIYRYILSGLDDIQSASIINSEYAFPMLPWKQNGLELIWHIREHLYNGVGLRQIIDWMMFAYQYLRDEDNYKEFKTVLDRAGLTTLAKTTTKMCQIYLGLDPSISWCSDADSDLCKEYMEFVLEQGNFGEKKQDDKATKVMTRYRNPTAIFKRLQQKRIDEWNVARKNRILELFAGVHLGIQVAHRYIRTRGIEQIIIDWKENKRRRKLFDKLYESETGNQHSR